MRVSCTLTDRVHRCRSIWTPSPRSLSNSTGMSRAARRNALPHGIGGWRGRSSGGCPARTRLCNRRLATNVSSANQISASPTSTLVVRNSSSA